eukprot:TRINITY_DN8883_c0_g3_i2.p1 TRINITY_DN8883_c0_g3~~TRINITY_DN8883_c0_g3_i2.p1  ORF type:complete len:685 (-),score=170.51 TRINITY_DN8883_c0_g3_i2:47-2080(-)
MAAAALATTAINGFPAGIPPVPRRRAAQASVPSSSHLVSGICAVGLPLAALWQRRHRSCCSVAAVGKVKVAPGEKVIGIDLGTTNSAVAALEAGKATVIPNSEGGRTTPSVVAYSKSGELLVGQIAKRQAAINPSNTYSSVKRFIGRLREEVSEEVAEVSYGVVGEASRSVRLQCPQLGRELAPEEVSAQVVTVPAYFNDSQRQATKDAGTIAGLEVLRIVNEPTAASLAYGLEKGNNETILVFDLGGGTFDVSVLVIGGGVCEVLATSGDTRLGGDNFDRCIVDWLADDFEAREGIDLRKDAQSLQRLTEAAEKAKMELSGVQEAMISLPFITMDASGAPLHIEERLTRATFEALSAELLERLQAPVQQALEDADVKFSELDEVVLVGGSTRICAVQALVSRLVGGKEPNQSVNPDEVVAMGAAVQAGVLAGDVKDLVLLDVIPLSLGVERHDLLNSVFLPRNTRVPVKKTKVFSTAKDNQRLVMVSVYQGERKIAKDNKMLGVFVLDGIPPSPGGFPQIEVTFDVDSNGILNVSALDLATRKETSLTVSGTSTLAPEDVEKKVEEAKKVAEEEAYFTGVVMVKNAAEKAAFGMEQCLRERRESMKASKVEVLESKVILLRELLEQDPINAELMKTVTEDVNMEISEILEAKVKEEYDAQEGYVFKKEKKPKRTVL